MVKDLKKFETLFKELFKPLCGFSMKYVRDLDTSKNLVHETFITVWEKFDELDADTNYRSYLFTAERNKSLNYIRDNKKHVALEPIHEEAFGEVNADLETSELEREIEIGIASLPEKCRMVFELHRMEGLKYGEIAQKMDISLKTVEAQMSKALRVLREHLGEFLTLIFFIFR